MRDCTAYITFDNTEANLTNTDFTRAANISRVRTTGFDRNVTGLPYNTIPIQAPTYFPGYCFDKQEVASLGFLGVDCNEDLSSCTMRFRGPRFRNNLAVVSLRRHTASPLKKGRLSYDFLDSNPSDTHSPLEDMSNFNGELDPLKFSGFYPYAPDDPVTIQKPAGWMYSNRNIPEPYLTQEVYEGGGGIIERSTAKRRKQLDFMPFVDPIRVYDLNEYQIGKFDGLVFVLFFGEMAFNNPVVDLPEYEGVLKDFTEAIDNQNPPYMNPNWQYIGLEFNIFLAGNGVLSPRIGRQRFMLPNRTGVLGNPNDIGGNYFSVFFKTSQFDSIDMGLNLPIKPSQVLADEPSIVKAKIPFSNLSILVSA